jgi:hypothetical protein
MHQAAYTPRAFEPIFTSQVPFFKRIIAKYFSADEQADVLQEFSIHFFLLYEKKHQVHAELFDSKAWLRTVVMPFGKIPSIRRYFGPLKVKWRESTS